MGRGDSERRCEPVVKDLLQQSHRKCDLQKNGTMVLGEFLNRLAGGSSVLEEDREYRVCARTAARTKGMRRKKRARSPVREIRRSNRLLGIEIHSDSESETPDPWAGRGTPRRTTFSREIETRTSPRLNLGYIIQNEAHSTETQAVSSSQSNNPKSTRKSFLNGVEECAKKYRKSYKNLSMRERSRRAGKLAQEVMGACINRESLDLSYASGDENYFEQNKDLAVDFLTLLDAMRHRVQREIKLNLMHGGELAGGMTPPPPSNEESLSPQDILADTAASAKMIFNTSIALLTATTRSGYAAVHNALIANPRLHEDGPKMLPSFFLLTKDRPNISSLNITAKDNIYSPINPEDDSSYYYNLLPLDDSVCVDQQVVDMMVNQLMQGYERRNKESKNTLKRFTNHKGNILVQNMKRLWDIFKHSMNSY
mmetsp:Transcript_23467/g.34113  ORF Transcript_23467/g.34113 Transcript_23467/m.34113 type:complete len:425 (-) Transcript_23467:41-1315(-)